VAHSGYKPALFVYYYYHYFYYYEITSEYKKKRNIKQIEVNPLNLRSYITSRTEYVTAINLLIDYALRNTK